MNGFGTLDRLVLLLLPLTFLATIVAVMILRPMSKAIAERLRGSSERLDDLEAALASLADSVARLEAQVRRMHDESPAIGAPQPTDVLLNPGSKGDPVS